MMAEPKYKINTKDKLTRVAGDLQKVLGVRGSAPAKTPAKGEVPPKKP
jgi:hypothetical protein